MSSLLLKLYSGILVVLIVFLSVFLYKKIKEQERGTIIQPVYTQTIPNAPNSEDLENTRLLNATTTEITKAVQPITSTTTVLIHQDASPSVNQVKEVREIDTFTEVQIGSKNQTHTCASPITYRLGTFDAGFDISRREFLNSLASSTSLWSNAMGKQLFTYSDTGELTINLIYDKRQAETIDNKLIGMEIQNTKDAASALETKYENLKVTFNTLKDEYTVELNLFNEKQKVYGETVTMWNEKGGAPQNEYNALNKTKAELETESSVLNSKREAIITMMKEINDLIAKHNELVLFANENITKNNSIPRKKFTEGQYNPNTNTITIYQFTDDLRLHRVLAHEFGHALGINHNKNPLSIMYYTNTATTTGLSKEDIRDLRVICNN